MDALTDICETNDLFWPSLMEDMRQEGRFHVETFF